MYLRPRTLDEACDALATGGFAILSGGTDLYPAHLDRSLPQNLIDISRLEELAGIAVAPDHVRIGGRTTWAAIARADLPACFAALKAAAREVGSVQIQTVATIAGNLCNASPAADGVPPLLILDAEVELVSRAGRRRLALAEFIAGNRRTARRPDEILAAIIVPRTMERARSAFLKLGARKYLVISIAMVAAAIEVDGEGRIRQARVAVGACSPVALRLPLLEKALIGAPARPGLGALIEARHLAALSPIDDIRATAQYRQEVVAQLIGRCLDRAVGEG